jgi:predicted dehydrogenase
VSKPRIGFVGTGWIGCHRLEALVAASTIDAVAICDPSPECAQEAARIAPGAAVLSSFEAMLGRDLDGLVIATPNALHAEQTVAALESGVAVFCQKPLGRDLDETRRAVAAAKQADRLLAVDFSYRLTAATQRLAELVRYGELGEIFAIDLTFHNAYGPDSRGSTTAPCPAAVVSSILACTSWTWPFGSPAFSRSNM